MVISEVYVFQNNLQYSCDANGQDVHQHAIEQRIKEQDTLLFVMISLVRSRGQAVLTGG
jgi:hypothetical protein